MTGSFYRTKGGHDRQFLMLTGAGYRTTLRFATSYIKKLTPYFSKNGKHTQILIFMVFQCFRLIV